MDNTTTESAATSNRLAQHHTAVSEVTHPQPATISTAPYVVVSNPGGGDANSKISYTKQNITSVRWLSKFQLIFSIIIIVLHIVTTGLDDHFLHKKAHFDNTKRFEHFFSYDSMADHAATGIWVGLLVLITSIIGLFGVKEQRKSLIITSLVMNLMSLGPLIALIMTVAISINAINYCRKEGEKYDLYPDYYYYDDNMTTTPDVITTTDMKTPHPDIEFFGETLSGKSGYFHCRAAYFMAWLALDVIIEICSVMEFMITLTLFIYNSIAACSHCCCCKPSSHVIGSVVYYNGHPTSTVPHMPVTTYPTMPPVYPTVPAAPPYSSHQGALPPINHQAGVSYTNHGMLTLAVGDNQEKSNELPPPVYSTH